MSNETRSLYLVEESISDGHHPYLSLCIFNDNLAGCVECSMLKRGVLKRAVRGGNIYPDGSTDYQGDAVLPDTEGDMPNRLCMVPQEHPQVCGGDETMTRELDSRTDAMIEQFEADGESWDDNDYSDDSDD